MVVNTDITGIKKMFSVPAAAATKGILLSCGLSIHPSLGLMPLFTKLLCLKVSFTKLFLAIIQHCRNRRGEYFVKIFSWILYLKTDGRLVHALFTRTETMHNASFGGRHRRLIFTYSKLHLKWFSNCSLVIQSLRSDGDNRSDFFFFFKVWNKWHEWHWNKWPTQRLCGVWEGFKRQTWDPGVWLQTEITQQVPHELLWHFVQTSTPPSDAVFHLHITTIAAKRIHPCQAQLYFAHESHVMRLWMTAILSGGWSSRLPSVSALYTCTISSTPAVLMTVVTATAHPSAVDGLIGLQMAIKVLLWP